MSRYQMTYGSDTVIVELGQPEDPILVDGEHIGRQCADGSCRTEDCMRIAARYCWGPLYETNADAAADDLDASTCAICVWEDVGYEVIADEDDDE